MQSPADHDAYIAGAVEPLRPLLINLRAQLSHALPDVDELIAYNMPGFGVDNTIIAGYAAFTKQCGLYVANEAIIKHTCAIAAEGLKATKTGVTFSPSKPISDALIAKLAISSRTALKV